MRESLRRRLKLPPLHPPSSSSPPPPPPKSHHHHSNDDELEEGEFKDVDPLKINVGGDHEHAHILQISPVKDNIETSQQGAAAVGDVGEEGEPECPVDMQETAHHDKEGEEEEDGNEGVLVSELGESEQDKSTVNGDDEGDGTPGTPVEEEEREGKEVVMEAGEERGQPEMADNQDEEATAAVADVGKTDDEQVVEELVGQPDLAMVVEEIEKVTEKHDVEDEDGPPPGWESGPPVNPLPPPLPPPPPEKGQLVCGSCRRLLSYPRGFKHVQCSCCQTVNYVLEEHQVGQVQCGNCLLLLMYPYGAHSVRCSSCRSITDIRDHNKRPCLSEQQSRAFRPFCVPL